MTRRIAPSSGLETSGSPRHRSQWRNTTCGDLAANGNGGGPARHSNEGRVMGMLRLKQVTKETGLSRMTIYRYEARGEFPRRRRLGANAVGWAEHEVAEWMRTRPLVASCASSVQQFNELP